MTQEHTEYQSMLGDIAVTTSHVERKSRDSDDWELLEKNFPEQMIADEIHFSNIEQITYTEGSTFPYIEFQTVKGAKKMFFSIGDPYKKIFTELKERLATYRQAYE